VGRRDAEIAERRREKKKKRRISNSEY